SAYVSHPLEAVPNGEFLQRLKQMPQPQLSLAGRNWSFEPEYAEALPSTLISAGEKRRLNQYEIIEKLGQGSMGVVYKARHTELGKFVALKVLPAAFTDELSLARFKNEARAASRLDHPNIVTTHDAGRDGGMHYLVMTFVDGADLGRLGRR